MSGYNPYADQGYQANGAAQRPFETQPYLPTDPGPAGYQQATPYGRDSPNIQASAYGGTSDPGYQSQGHGGAQSPGYFPPQGQPGTDDSGGVGGLTSQMGEMGLGSNAAYRSNKKKNRHAYHNLDQPTVASQAFNQSMGNAPQYVNQDGTQQVNPGHAYAAQQVTPAMSQFPPQNGPIPFSPGLQQSPSSGIQNTSVPKPVLCGPGVSAQGKVDPEQIPSIPKARDSAAQYYLDHIYPTMEQHLPPPGGIPFVAQDQGNSSPKFARLTLNNIPSSSDALASTGLPLGLVLQPLAPLQAGEQAIPVLDFGDLGPPRCRRCRAYINPFMVFRSGGNKFVCNMCTFPNDVSPEYFAPIDPSGVRVDRAQRPELTSGTVEYLVPKEYWAKEPVALRWLFVIDVSQDAVDKQFLEAFCEGILSALYGNATYATNSEQTDGESPNGKLSLPVSAKVGFVTYDKAVHFYNCSENLEQAQMLVMPDIEDSFVPLGSDGLFVDPYKSKSIITSLLRKLPSLFSLSKNPEPTLLPTLESAISSLSATGGKILCSLASLPTWGPGRLFLRDKNDLHGIETEKKLFQTEHPGWKKLAGKMVESGVGVDFFIAAAGGHASAVSGGETFFYPNFLAPRDALQLFQDIQHTVTRETGYQALMKVRCSNGLQVSSYHGNFLQHNFGADLEFGVIDADKTVGVMFSYDGKLDPKLDAHFQCALLYTTAGGERRVRCTNTVASVSDGASESMRFIDQDAVVHMISKEAATRMTERPLKDIRNALTEKTVDILAGYRKSFSTSYPPGQLVLPENLKEFSMYILGLIKSRAFRAGHEPSDRRTHTMRLLKSISQTALSPFLYPRILPLHTLPPESGFPDPNTGHLIVPPTLRASFGRIEKGGAYLVDDGQTCLLWLHSHVSPNLLEDLFGPGHTSLQSLDPMSSSLPTLETHLNAQVRNILAYWGSFRGSKSGPSIPIYLARQGLDGSEFEFARMLVEDRNNEAQSYIDWLVNVHRHIQMELAGQRKREDGGGGGLGLEASLAGIANLWSGKEG
ncbi:MAG: hypothetical protein Q9163_004749 [Psora crenata]